MEYVRHDAILVTSWNLEILNVAAAKASELGFEVLGPSVVMTS